MTDDPQVRDLSRRIRAVQPKWHAEAIAEAARGCVAYDRAYGMAHDSAASLDRSINAFFRGGTEQMPIQPSPGGAAAMPASRGDNFTGSSHTGSPGAYALRNGRARDQAGAEELLDLVGQTLSRWDDTEVQRFIDGLNSLLSGGNNTGPEAEDENGYSPMQFRGQGQGSSPADLIRPGSIEGTFAEKDPSRNAPRGASDSRPRDPRQRRLAHDRGQPQMSAAERHRGFQSRWGALTAHIDCWR